MEEQHHGYVEEMVEIDPIRHHDHTSPFDSQTQLSPSAATPMKLNPALSDPNASSVWLPSVYRRSGVESLSSTPAESRSATPSLVGAALQF
jgi:hypothetical protein